MISFFSSLLCYNMGILYNIYRGRKDMTFNQVYNELNKFRKLIGKPAYKTLLGQCKNGDIEGAMKGYLTLLKKKHNIEYTLTRY